MDLEKARRLLRLGIRVTRKDIRAAYRRAARQWHPDGAPPGSRQEYHVRMQEINEAYQCIKKFLENYRYRLEEPRDPQDDYQSWWQEHFGQDVLWETRKPRQRRQPKTSDQDQS